MEFTSCNIAGIQFGAYFEMEEGYEKVRTFLNDKGIDFAKCKRQEFDEHFDIIMTSDTDKYPLEAPLELVTDSETDSIKSTKDITQLFILAMAICNECLIEIEGDQINYTSSSPDEIALCIAAKQFGSILKSRKGNKATVQIEGEETNIEIIMNFEFDADRKAQSIIIKTFGKYYHLIKGADSAIIDILDKDRPQPFLPSCSESLYKLSIQGLRTLCYGVKMLSQKQFDEINGQYNDILSKPKRDENLKKLAVKIEKNFMLLGCTAIEDQLQENVAQTIKTLSDAEIKIWMITGDKLETAENIALSCRIIRPDMETIVMKDFSPKDFSTQFEEVRSKFESISDDCEKAIVMEMSSMDFIFNMNDSDGSEDDVENIAKLLLKADAVVCCRATPKQKAKLVNLVKSRDYTTLSIGDGANDVNMINEAHVGVGIYGQEGLQAVNASDFGIGEFQTLAPLLLVQGRWFHWRNSMCMRMIFYKNLLFSFPLFIFGFYSFFSGLQLYEELYATYYNLLFTQAPCMILSLYDVDVAYRDPKPYCYKDPEEKREIFQRP